MSKKYNLITILGPTASGKTGLAVSLSHTLDTEIISADSRQVYRGMDLGTGKDIEEYTMQGVQVPYHLIDIMDAGSKYNVYEFKKDFNLAFQDISVKGKIPILCGGSGLYIEAVLKDYKFIEVPSNATLREELEAKSLKELADMLKSLKSLHNKSDIETKRRVIRAIEIELYYKVNQDIQDDGIVINSLVIGVDIERELRRTRISQRLKTRLDNGMINEVHKLLNSGINPEDLIYYGLEYKYLTLHIIGQLSYDEMFTKLEIEIHQFAKRQMTWFRKMERNGIKINWIDSQLPNNEKVQKVLGLLNN